MKSISKAMAVAAFLAISAAAPAADAPDAASTLIQRLKNNPDVLDATITPIQHVMGS